MKSINKILSAILSGDSLSTEQLHYIDSYLHRQEVRAEMQKMLTARRNRCFHEKLMKVFIDHPNTPLTATEIQFLLPCAMENRISVQKISRHLAMMQFSDEFRINNARVTMCDTGSREAVVWYIGEVEFEQPRTNFSHKTNLPLLCRPSTFWYDMMHL